MKQIYLSLTLMLITLGAFSQRYTISGYVTDKESGERLINANVYDAKTLRGTTANTYGFYSISLPAGEITIVASFIGYTPQQFTFDLKTDISLNIELEMQTDQLGEVTIMGNQVNKVEDTQMSMVEIPIQKLQKIPVIMGEADVLKVMQLLPGVSGGTEGTSGIYVRGGGPDQNLFLLDGVPVYNAGHLLGFFSVFNPDALKTVKLYKGGFPARFGGRLSSVVDIAMKDGNMKNYSGSFSIGAISSKLSFEGPIVKDKTSFIISGRRTYLDIMTKPFIIYANMLEGGNSEVLGGAYFHDYNLKVNHIFNDRSRLYLSGYFGADKGYGGYKDTYNQTVEGKKVSIQDKQMFGLGWGNTIGSLRWNYLISNKLFSNTTLTYSKYVFDVSLEFEQKNLTDKTKEQNYFKYFSGIEDISAKVDFDYYRFPGHEIKFGAQYTYHHFSPGVTEIKISGADEDINDLLGQLFKNRKIPANDVSVYIEDEIKINTRFNLNVGAHLSWFNVQETNYIHLQPRISARYKAGENWSLKASYSRMAQHLHLLSTSGISLPTDLWLPVTKEFAPPISDQVAIGTAIDLPANLVFTIEGYYKNMANFIEYKEGASFTGSATNWEQKVEKGRGWAYGGEFMLEKTLGKTTGWVGYTLSWTERQFDNLNFGNPFPAKYDNRHDVSIALTHEFSKRFDIGISWIYHTGNAVTLGTMEFSEAEFIGGRSAYYYGNLVDYEGRNNFRMPPTHRLDVGLNLHKKKKYGMRTWNLSVYNAYNRKNPFFLMWDTNYEESYNNMPDGSTYYSVESETVLKKFSLYPIIPTLTYSYSF